ncbi:Sec-independent protein translocase protein TatC [Nymphon striatum]|nr:Sec-independent protein translocase protein TatC [Nymphon striatum]
MLNNIGLPGILLIAVVVLVLFGRGKISSLMGEVGKGITSFKKGINEGEKELADDAEVVESEIVEASDTTKDKAVSAEGLGNVRKYAVVAILVLAALVTPPDVITQVILFVVVYGLYEISIQLVKRVEKTREAKLRAEGYYDDDEEEDDDPDG